MGQAIVIVSIIICCFIYFKNVKKIWPCRNSKLYPPSVADPSLIFRLNPAQCHRRVLSSARRSSTASASSMTLWATKTTKRGRWNRPTVIWITTKITWNWASIFWRWECRQKWQPLAGTFKLELISCIFTVFGQSLINGTARIRHQCKENNCLKLPQMSN